MVIFHSYVKLPEGRWDTGTLWITVLIGTLYGDIMSMSNNQRVYELTPTTL